MDNIEKFNPTIAEIQSVVDEGRLLTITNFSDENEVKAVRNHRLKLKNVRVSITKQGKAYREQAVTFQKLVIAKEKELISLLEPEEERLAQLEEQADVFIEREKRRELLPKRLERLVRFNDGVEVSDDEILDMNSTDFEVYCNKRLADKNEKDRLALEIKERELKEAEAKAARENEIKEAEDRARKEERERADKAEADLKTQREREERDHRERIEREEREAKERAERTEREAKERAEKIENEAKEKAEREERERKEKAEAEAKEEFERKENLAKDKKYQEFLVSHGCTNETAREFHATVRGNVHTLYKKVGEITL